MCPLAHCCCPERLLSSTTLVQWDCQTTRATSTNIHFDAAFVQTERCCPPSQSMRTSKTPPLEEKNIHSERAQTSRWTQNLHGGLNRAWWKKPVEETLSTGNINNRCAIHVDTKNNPCGLENVLPILQMKSRIAESLTSQTFTHCCQLDQQLPQGLLRPMPAVPCSGLWLQTSFEAFHS